VNSRRDIFELTGCVVDLAMRVVRWPGEERSLSPTEARLLRYFVDNAGDPVDRDRLLEEVWGYRPGVISATVKTTMRRLRSKIELDPSQPHHIQTLSGGGYLFVAEPSEHALDEREQAPPVLLANEQGRGNLGHYLSERFGRDAELQRLRSLLADDAAPLVTVTGPGGVGKTALVRWAAEDLRLLYDEVWVCDLHGATSRDALVESLFETVGLASPPDSESAAAVLAPALALRGRVLLVLDHVEAVLEAAAAVCSKLVAAATTLQVVVVSRVPLRMTAEVVVRLGPLVDAAAASLFRSRAGSEALDGYGDDRALAGVLDRLDGLPHAIEMASAWAGLLKPAELEGQLENQIRLLVDDRSERPARHDSLRASVALSWSLIDEASREVLSQCAVFSGAFDVEAAAAVVSLEGDDWGSGWRNIIRDLLQRSLLVRDGAGEDGASDSYFRILHGVRGLVRHERPAPAARLRHAEHYARWGVPATHLELRRGRDRSQLERVLSEEDEILKAAGYAAEQERPDLAVACMHTLYFLRTSPWLGGVLREVSDAVAASASASAAERCEALLLGACSGRGRKEAAQLLRQATGLAIEAERQDLEAEGYRRLTFLLRAHELDEGLKCGRRALQLAESCGDTLTLARCSNTLARAVLISGDHIEARQLLEHAVSLARDVDDAHTLGTCLHHLALLHIERDRPGMAIFLVEEAIEVLRARKPRQTLCVYFLARGSALARLERFDEALLVSDEALGESLRHGSAEDQADVISHRAELFRQQGRLNEARRGFEEAQTLYRQVGPRDAVIHSTGMLGELALERGNLPLASQFLDQSVRMAAEGSNPLLEGMFEGARGTLWAVQDDAERAREALRRGDELLERGGDRHERRRLLRRWAEAEALLGDLEAAKSLYTRLEQEEMLFSQADVPAPSLTDTAIHRLLAERPEE